MLEFIQGAVGVLFYGFTTGGVRKGTVGENYE